MPRRKSPVQTGSGSPPSGEPVYLVVGKLRRPHGVQGEILMEIITDFPERLRPKTQVFIGEVRKPHKIMGRRGHNDGLLLRFENYDDRDQVGVLRNELVYVQAADLPELPDGEYYHHQLIGLTVITDNESILGQLTEIIETGANDVYVVIDESGRELLLPAIPSVLLDVNLDSATMKVHLIEGLLDE